jgi:hypothetical protein
MAVLRCRKFGAAGRKSHKLNCRDRYLEAASKLGLSPLAVSTLS